MAEQFILEQERLNPAIPSTTPVVDNTDAVTISGAADLLEKGLDLRDKYITSKLSEEFADFANQTPADSAIRDEMAQRLAKGDFEAVDRLNKELDKLALAEKQGVPGATTKQGLKILQQQKVRQAITDYPWLSSEIRSLATTYRVSGFGGGSSSSDSPNDPFVDAENKVLEEARKLHLAGVPEQDKAQLLRMAVLNEAQRDVLQSRSRGGFMLAASEGVERETVGFQVRLHQQMDADAAAGTYNPDAYKEMINTHKAFLKREIRRGYDGANARGAYFKIDQSEMDTMVDNQTAYLEAAIEAKNPTLALQRIGEYRSLRGMENIAMSDTTLGRLVRVGWNPKTGRADETLAKMIELAEKTGAIQDLFGGFTSETMKAMTPQEQGVLTLLQSQNPVEFQKGLDALLQGAADGTLYGQGAGRDMVKNLVSLGLHPSVKLEGPDGALFKAAFNGLMKMKGTVGLDLFLDFVPMAGEDGLAPDAYIGMKNLLSNNEATISQTLPMNMVDSSAGAGFGEVEEWQRFQVAFDEEKKEFVLQDFKTGEPINPLHSIRPSTTQALRDVRVINKMWKVRNKFGSWDDKSPDEFKTWATSFGPNAVGPKEPVGTQKNPIRYEYDEFGTLKRVPSGPAAARPLIPGRGVGLMEQQIAAEKAAMTKNEELGLTDKVAKELSSVEPKAVDLYTRISEAETGGEQNRFIRTKIRSAPGGSTAYGPAQLTKSLAEGFLRTQPDLFTSDEKQYLERFIQQGNLFLKYGNKQGLSAAQQKYDYGGEGDLTSPRDKQAYAKVVTKMLDHYYKKFGGDEEKIVDAWRFGESAGLSVKENDQRYYKKVFGRA